MDRLVVHFQRFLALPNCPQITLSDTELPQPIDLGKYFRENFLIERQESTFKIAEERFEVIHLLHRISGDASEQRHTITMLANGRPA